MKTKVNDV